MKWSWKLTRLAGIDVYVHATFFTLIAWIGAAAEAGMEQIKSTLSDVAVGRAMPTDPLDYWYGDDSARRGGINLCRTWAGERDLQQRDLRRYGHSHRPDHVATAFCHEVVLRSPCSADAVVDCCLDTPVLLSV